jgi:hypothetical protein
VFRADRLDDIHSGTRATRQAAALTGLFKPIEKPLYAMPGGRLVTAVCNQNHLNLLHIVSDVNPEWRRHDGRIGKTE